MSYCVSAESELTAPKVRRRRRDRAKTAQIQGPSCPHHPSQCHEYDTASGKGTETHRCSRSTLRQLSLCAQHAANRKPELSTRNTMPAATRPRIRCTPAAALELYNARADSHARSSPRKRVRCAHTYLAVDRSDRVHARSRGLRRGLANGGEHREKKRQPGTRTRSCCMDPAGHRAGSSHCGREKSITRR